jgi:probable blue pigment (indigoidine) exporter
VSQTLTNRQAPRKTHVPTRPWSRLTQTRRGRTVIMLFLIPFYAACFAALRLLVAGAGLLLLAGVTRQPLRIARRLWPWLLALALSAGSFGYGAMFMSPGTIGAGIASVLGNTQPVILVALGATLLGERITRQAVGTLVLGLAGVVTLALTAMTEWRLGGLLGALLAFASAVSFAIAALMTKRLGSSAPLLAMTGWQFVLGAALLFALSARWEGGSRILWTPSFVALLLLLGLGGSALTTAVWYWLIQHDDVGRLSLYLYLVPIVGITLAVVIFGERLTLLSAVGMGLTGFAVLGALRHDARSPTTTYLPSMSVTPSILVRAPQDDRSKATATASAHHSSALE